MRATLPRLRIDASDRSSVNQSIALAISCRLLTKRSPAKFAEIWYTVSLTNSELPSTTMRVPSGERSIKPIGSRGAASGSVAVSAAPLRMAKAYR